MEEKEVLINFKETIVFGLVVGTIAPCYAAVVLIGSALILPAGLPQLALAHYLGISSMIYQVLMPILLTVTLVYGIVAGLKLIWKFGYWFTETLLKEPSYRLYRQCVCGGNTINHKLISSGCYGTVVHIGWEGYSRNDT